MNKYNIKVENKKNKNITYKSIKEVYEKFLGIKYKDDNKIFPK